MPRNGRGGARTGTPGQGYANRTDLHAVQPIRVAPSAQYGQGVAQADAQRAIPLPAQPPPAAPMGGAAPPAPQGPPVLPGSLGEFHRPTERPSEPLQAGLATGPGGGPPPAPDPMLTVAAILNRLPAEHDSPEAAALRNVLNASLANRGAP